MLALLGCLEIGWGLMDGGEGTVSKLIPTSTSTCHIQILVLHQSLGPSRTLQVHCQGRPWYIQCYCQSNGPNYPCSLWQWFCLSDITVSAMYGHHLSGATWSTSLLSSWSLRRWLTRSRANGWVVVGMMLKIPSKIGLVIQQIGDKLVVVPLVHHCVAQVSVPSVIEGAGTTVLPTGNIDSDTTATLPMAEAATAPVPAAGPLMDAHHAFHLLFSQQFMIQQRVEDLWQELINEFINQKRYMQHMNGDIRRIAIQPVVHPVVFTFSSQSMFFVLLTN